MSCFAGVVSSRNVATTKDALSVLGGLRDLGDVEDAGDAMLSAEEQFDLNDAERSRQRLN